mgnify:CR=1 FL=1
MKKNPLLDFARKMELSVKLPSKGRWYTDEIMDTMLNGEVGIFPMTPRDELLQYNPDALLSGDTTIQIIESCVPSIKNAKDLLYNDANLLLLAIRKATYGDELEQSVICPRCYEEASKLTEDEKAEADRTGRLKFTPQDNVFSISDILSCTQYLDDEYKMKLDNGLTVYFKPYTVKNKLNFELTRINQQKILDFYKNFNQEDLKNEEIRKDRINKITDIYLEMNKYGNEVIASCILKIELPEPDGSFVDDYDMILEYISNTNSNYIQTLKEKIEEINSIGLPSELEYECSCCGHKWKSPFIEFNPTDFFDGSSSF